MNILALTKKRVKKIIKKKNPIILKKIGILILKLNNKFSKNERTSKETKTFKGLNLILGPCVMI
tara:strand:+ start:8913 stop:9104 length:192 start_codon:yes stop_codon:yes gene_type:complete